MNEQIATLVRRHDPDRFLTALFAPPDKRDDLLTLYAFNHELARAREVVSEPPRALIRLQWWREIIEGHRRRHEVATPLGDALDRGTLSPTDLLPMIEAREQEVEPEIPSLTEWQHYMLTGPGSLAVAAARLLGIADPTPFRSAGAAFGVAGMLRTVASLAVQRRCLLPTDLLAAQGLSPQAVIADPDGPAVNAVLRQLVEQGRSFVAATPRRLPRNVVAAALPAVLAQRDLARWPRIITPRRLGDRLAVTAAGLTGRLPR